MKFLDRQEDARDRSRLLSMLLVAILFGGLVPMNLVLMFAFPPLGLVFTDRILGGGIDSLITFSLFSLASAVVVALIVARQRRRMREAGEYFAGQFGAIEVKRGTGPAEQQRLLNVVEEMAVAAGVPTPRVYVLPRDRGLNAMSAGRSSAEAAIFATQRMLTVLSREELQAVIAHEFSHILNGDMALNLRVASYVHAFRLIPRAGEWFLGWRHEHRGFGAWLLFGWWIGLIISALGLVHQAGARLVQAALSRQREKLADASAVQLTRNPAALKGALLKIAALGSGSNRLSEAEHMCFAATFDSRLLQSHPPIEERIRAVDPTFLETEIAECRKQERRRELMRQKRVGEAFFRRRQARQRGRATG